MTENSEPLVVLTPKAVEKTRLFMSENQEGALRVGVRGGGCSGFQYLLAIDEVRDDDLTWEQEGITIVCDKDQTFYLNGATLDYKETIEESGFVFDNPLATSSCGCGSSFRVDDQQGCDAVSPEDIYL